MSRRCIVVGGSGVVGRQVVMTLLAQDAQVAFTYCSGTSAAAELQSVAPGLTAGQLDLNHSAAVEPALSELATRLGGVDALIVAAGTTSTLTPAVFEDIDSVDLEGFERLARVNLVGAFAACRAAARQMANGGNIILLGSINGVKPIPSPPPYAASKAALGGLAQSLAKALGAKKICVNVVAPGLLEDGASRTAPETLKADYLRHCSLRRFGTAEEVANVVSWLALHNTYVTGQTLLVDGGL